MPPVESSDILDQNLHIYGFLAISIGGSAPPPFRDSIFLDYMQYFGKIGKIAPHPDGYRSAPI